MHSPLNPLLNMLCGLQQQGNTGISLLACSRRGEMHASRDTPAPQANVSQAVTAAFYYSDSRRFPPECSRKLTAALMATVRREPRKGSSERMFRNALHYPAAWVYLRSGEFPFDSEPRRGYIHAALSIPPQAFGYGKQGFQGDAVPLSISPIN